MAKIDKKNTYFSCISAFTVLECYAQNCCKNFLGLFMLEKAKKELRTFAEPDRIPVLKSFFKTKPGEYGHGDKFIGVRVPNNRIVAKKYIDMSFSDLRQLIKSAYHEERLLSLLILVERIKRSNEQEKESAYTFYLKHAEYVNNWDLVDASAEYIVGGFLKNKTHKEIEEVLIPLAQDSCIWKRRISMISCFCFIKNKNFNCSLKIAKILLNDEHDLIQKAVGWMLREIGKRDLDVEKKFLDKYYKVMPRTMLRYAIERFIEKDKKYYMAK